MGIRCSGISLAMIARGSSGQVVTIACSCRRSCEPCERARLGVCQPMSSWPIPHATVTRCARLSTTKARKPSSRTTPLVQKVSTRQAILCTALSDRVLLLEAQTISAYRHTLSVWCPSTKPLRQRRWRAGAVEHREVNVAAHPFRIHLTE